ncbi:MAG: Flp family type IVb pilin [Acidobacteria bacterium]|nr:Flp family type IVb pilin [Acidobacteriota bacterium]
MPRTRAAIRKRCDNESGASLVEYALLVAFIAIVAVVAIALLGQGVSSSFDNLSSGF